MSKVPEDKNKASAYENENDNAALDDDSLISANEVYNGGWYKDHAGDNLAVSIIADGGPFKRYGEKKNMLRAKKRKLKHWDEDQNKIPVKRPHLRLSLTGISPENKAVYLNQRKSTAKNFSKTDIDECAYVNHKLRDEGLDIAEASSSAANEINRTLITRFGTQKCVNFWRLLIEKVRENPDFLYDIEI